MFSMALSLGGPKVLMKSLLLYSETVLVLAPCLVKLFCIYLTTSTIHFHWTFDYIPKEG